MKKNDKLEQLNQLTKELHRVRQVSLDCSRKGDFRQVARLTSEAARLNRAISALEGAAVPALERIGDQFFVGNEDGDRRSSSVYRAFALAESA